MVVVYLITCISLPDQEDAKTSRSDQRHNSHDYSQHDDPRGNCNRRIFAFRITVSIIVVAAAAAVAVVVVVLWMHYSFKQFWQASF